MEIYDNDEEDRLYFEQQENTASFAQMQRRTQASVLPKVVEAYMRSASEVSLHNPVLGHVVLCATRTVVQGYGSDTTW